VKRKDLVAQLEELIPIINRTLNTLTHEDMEAEFPIFFDQPKNFYGLRVAAIVASFELSSWTGKLSPPRFGISF
jgi:hypothetical protein